MTTKQLNTFHKDGFLQIERPFPPGILNLWHKNAEYLASTLRPQTSKNTFFYSTGELGRINDLMRYFPKDVIALMATEPLLEIAYKICGKNAVPLSCDLLIKREGSHSSIAWHQDVVHNRKYPFIVIGIYLDDSNLNDGQLSIVKGSHFKKQNISQLDSSISAKEVPVKSGDIIIHDAMVLHRSEMKKNPGKRRTIYVEMRPYEAIIDDGFQSEKWANLRKTWMEFVLTTARTTWQNKFCHSHKQSASHLEEFVQELLREFSPYPPAHYG